MIKKIILGTIGLLLLIPLLSLFSKRFYQVQAETIVNTAAQPIWKVLAEDFGDIYQYTENVVASEYMTNQTENVGTKRRCELKGGGFMEEEITVWEKEKEIKINILNSSMPTEPGTNLIFKLDPINDQQTKVTAIGNYRLKYIGILSPIIGQAPFQELAEGLLQIAKVNGEKLQ